MVTFEADSRGSMSHGDEGSTTTTSSRKKLFYTTSDMMTTINKALSDMDSPDDDDDMNPPRVELQRRMPDGTTRRANEKDLEAADMDSKLKQAAEEVAHLSPTKKMEWAQYQRNEGNVLYKKGEYRDALDVYLTCLVAKTDHHEEFLSQVFLPVMNNLAQTCLQLKMYRKAQQFCTMALDEISSNRDDDVCAAGDDDDDEQQLPIVVVAKLYFRRGRARRLSGEYAQARSDLHTALLMLKDDSTEIKSVVVERELQLVQRAEVEGRRNQKRQERAMKQMLGGEVDDEDQKAGHVDPGSTASRTGLYQDVRSRRMYSTLTSKRTCKVETDETVSYWRWYLSVIGGVAERLLMLLGDEEYEKRRKQDEEADSSHPKHD